ncbi:MAG: hypothetical protein KatS3mg109_1954 [Pirellulaceae bacterium]|nr:MAG: hypothetical protein KatS3mg109_1954 [Pirellulaceae bacterium]
MTYSYLAPKGPVLNSRAGCPGRAFSVSSVPSVANSNFKNVCGDSSKSVSAVSSVANSHGGVLNGLRHQARPVVRSSVSGTNVARLDGDAVRLTSGMLAREISCSWDIGTRLVAASDFLRKDAQGAIVLDVHYSYDVFDRRIGKTVDPDGDGAQGPSFTWFVYDNPSVVTGASDPALVGADHIVLEFTASQPAVLKYRYLHGPVVDQVFAREDVESLWQPGEVLWALGDHLGTVRDLIDSSGTVVNHLRYEAFGRITSETNAAVDFLFAYTGRERDEESGLFYYRARYYDPAVGRFISEDPLGFAAGDATLARYVGNATTIYVDPTGREERRRSNDRITPEEEIKKTLPGRIIDYLFGKGLDENIEHNRHGLSSIDDLLNKGNLTPLGRREFYPETVETMERLPAFGVDWNSHVRGGAFVHPSVWQGKFWHRKSTARWPRSVTPQNLRQQLAAEEVVNNPAIRDRFWDPRRIRRGRQVRAG